MQPLLAGVLRCGGKRSDEGTGHFMRGGQVDGIGLHPAGHPLALLPHGFGFFAKQFPIDQHLLAKETDVTGIGDFNIRMPDERDITDQRPGQQRQEKSGDRERPAPFRRRGASQGVELISFLPLLGHGQRWIDITVYVLCLFIDLILQIEIIGDLR